MREIKFRVVLKDKTIYEITSLHWYRPEVEPKGMCGATIKTESGHDKFIPIEDIEAVLEFTGLKDKNGKGVEVYEGDLIQNHPNFKPLTVEFRRGVFGCWVPKPNDVDHTEEFNALDMLLGNHKVVGNIWQNPELLKGDQ